MYIYHIPQLDYLQHVCYEYHVSLCVLVWQHPTWLNFKLTAYMSNMLEAICKSETWENWLRLWSAGVCDFLLNTCYMLYNTNLQSNELCCFIYHVDQSTTECEDAFRLFCSYLTVSFYLFHQLFTFFVFLRKCQHRFFFLSVNLVINWMKGFWNLPEFAPILMTAKNTSKIEAIKYVFFQKYMLRLFPWDSSLFKMIKYLSNLSFNVCSLQQICMKIVSQMNLPSVVLLC